MTDKLFTGQREMADLGIYHYQARFYSPYINRFLSADTIVPSYANPHSLNRYTYVNYSPLNYTDPTGHTACQTFRLEIRRGKVKGPLLKNEASKNR